MDFFCAGCFLWGRMCGVFLLIAGGLCFNGVMAMSTESGVSILCDFSRVSGWVANFARAVRSFAFGEFMNLRVFVPNSQPDTRGVPAQKKGPPKGGPSPFAARERYSAAAASASAAASSARTDSASRAFVPRPT